jgi:hypothetical protein
VHGRKQFLLLLAVVGVKALAEKSQGLLGNAPGAGGRLQQCGQIAQAFELGKNAHMAV